MKLHTNPDICYCCGVMNAKSKDSKKFRSLVETHHIKEKNEGGSNEPGNLVPVCSLCHSKIHLGLITIDRWYDVGYCKKLKWIDEDGEEKFGPGY